MNASPTHCVRHRLTCLVVRSCALVAVALLGAARLPAQAPTEPAAAEPVIVMSPYEVLASGADFSRWIVASSPHFVIYTDASTKEVSRILRNLEMLRMSAQIFFRREVLNDLPITLVLPTSGSDWRKLATKGSIEWKAAATQCASRITDAMVLQYDWQERGSYLIWSICGPEIVRRMNLQLDLWFSQGLGAFFETATFTDDTIKLGHASVRSLANQRGTWIPWPRFFVVDSSSPEFREERRIREFSGQCATFVQYMLTHSDLTWTPRLLIWSSYLAADHEPNEAVFRELFGHDWEGWTKLLNSYLTDGSYRVWTSRFEPSLLNFPIETRSADPTAIRELFVLVQILVQDIPASDESLDTLLARGLRTLELRELLGEACLDRKKPEAALKVLQELIAEGSTNPDVHTTVAAARFHQAVPKISIHARITSEDLEEIRVRARAALDISPLHVPASATLAWAEALAPEVNDESLAVIGDICRTLDGNGRTDDVISALAVARWRAGRSESARLACETLLQSSFADKDSRELATAVMVELGFAPAPTAEPAADTTPTDEAGSS